MWKKFYLVSKSKGKDAKKLNGIGEKMAATLDKKLADYYKYAPLFNIKGTRNHPYPASTACFSGSDSKSKNTESSAVCAKVSVWYVLFIHSIISKHAVPRETTNRKGAYALVLALYLKSKDGITHLLKNELIALAQDYCDSSFEMVSADKKYVLIIPLSIEHSFVLQGLFVLVN